jgi:hypothetical protein
MATTKVESIIKDAVFTADAEKKAEDYRRIREVAKKAGIFPAIRRGLCCQRDDSGVGTDALSSRTFVGQAT